MISRQSLLSLGQPSREAPFKLVPKICQQSESANSVILGEDGPMRSIGACSTLWEHRTIMSVIEKHSKRSAFIPVIKSTKTFKHPFSISSILNLDELQQENDSCTSNERRINLSPCTPFAYQDSSDLVPQRDLNETVISCGTMNGDDSMPAWIYATRYSRQGIPTGAFVNARRPRKPLKKHKQRPLFAQKQIQRLEEEFSSEKYISKSRRSALADEIKLTDAQVRTWFQNRRTRWRKEEQLADYRGHSDLPQPWVATAPHLSDSNDEDSIQYNASNSIVVRGYCRM